MSSSQINNATQAPPPQVNVSSLSQVLFSIRPWHHEQEMVELIALVLGIQMEGVLWGATTTENVGYGVRELLVTAVLDENLVSIDNVLAELVALDEFISQVSIRLWNKVQ